MGDYILAFPVGGDFDLLTVGSHMVVLFRYLRGIVLEMIAPGISGVHIDGIAVSVKLPHSGYIDLSP